MGSLRTSVARASRSVRVWRGALLFAGALGLAVVSLQTVPAAHASTALHYQRGHYLDNGWYCYGWANGTYHCTAHWHHSSAGHIISDNPSWVPNDGTTSSSRRTTTRSQSSHTSGSGAVSAPPAGIGPWVKPAGYDAYSMSSHGFYSGWFGWCTWYAAYRHQNEPLMRLGNADTWAWNAPKYGLKTGTHPAVGATVVFQPHVQGASGVGHVGHVEKVYSNGWFLISEMSFYWNGGGWGRVSYRYVHTGAGVSFIY
ncbi:MAG TPA: CHAP domain-containing protein [Ktedonobacterales bacterium]|nr:CHAP domain-containing protein [Ktedonobacterales bacterium]